VVSLPLTPREPLAARAALAAAPTRDAGVAQSTDAQLDGVRVLLVDDDADALDLGTTVLAGAGAVVRGCRSAAEELETFRQWRADIVVSDIEMPDEDGYALIRKIRGLGTDRGGATPAVALTAYGRTQDRAMALTAGFNMHVPKPVDPGELTAIVATLARPTSVVS
jgi:CheY-like chemotaxis protein